MDDSYFFGVLAYLFIASMIAGFLLTGFYSGTQNQALDSEEFWAVASGSIEDIDGFSGQLNFFQKILTFLFVTWVIDGLPAVLVFVVMFINISSLLVISIYSYDKIRGIS